MRRVQFVQLAQRATHPGPMSAEVPRTHGLRAKPCVRHYLHYSGHDKSVQEGALPVRFDVRLAILIYIPSIN